MNPTRAKELAEAFLESQDMKGNRWSFIETKSVMPDSWTVIFEVQRPNGVILDSPLIVIIDQTTGHARFFDSL